MTLAARVVVMNEGQFQQIGTPTEIYDTPANTFVAGFIGSPAMNLVTGDLSNGTFKAENISISGFKQAQSGPVILGFRAEDASVVKTKKSEVSAPIYTVELLGDATMVMLRVGDGLVSVRTDKEYRAEIGSQVNISIPSKICHLFDASTGERIDS